MTDEFDIDPGTVEPPFADEQFEGVAGDPQVDPTQLLDGYEVYCAEEMNGIVPEFITVIEHPHHNPDVYSRKWVFEGLHGVMVFQAYQRHRYGPNTEPPQVESQVQRCCFQMMRKHGLRAEHCPDAVRDIVARIADAPVASLNERDHDAAAAEE